ncbi:C69 family dipeptidase, partial [Weissella soli]
MVANVKKFYSSCTTILVGKAASYDGSTIVARTEDSANGQFAPKRFVVVTPEEQPKVYTSVISGVTITLPENPMRYTSVPNAILDDGLWAEAGINDANVAVSATETITTNERVLGADPMVPGGIGEEDITTIVLPYIHSAREGVELLGQYLEKYGTYEHNGIAFS